MPTIMFYNFLLLFDDYADLDADNLLRMADLKWLALINVAAFVSAVTEMYITLLVYHISLSSRSSL